MLSPQANERSARSSAGIAPRGGLAGSQWKIKPLQAIENLILYY